MLSSVSTTLAGRKLKLQLKDSTNKELCEVFQCIGCDFIVVDPIMCGSCEKLICADCFEIMDALREANHKECPKCEGDEWDKINVQGIVIQNTLQNLEFKCPEPHCRLIYKYRDRAEHHSLCEARGISQRMMELETKNRDLQDEI